MTEKNWDHSADVVIVGSGNGAMTAALSLYEMGVKDVLIIEKSSLIGGTSATSGGGVWIPNNRYAKAAGAQDSFADAKQYLLNTTPDGAVPEEMVDAYLQNGPKMVEFLHQRSDVRYVTLEHYPDYYTNIEGSRAGHRSMEPERFDSSLLGEDVKRLRPSHHMMRLFDRIYFTQVEAALLTVQGKGWIALTLKLMASFYFDILWRLKGNPNSRKVCTGAAGVARLWYSLKKRNIPLWSETAMQNLIEDQGRVVGLSVSKGGKTLSIQARKGVVLAAGGFEKNQAMREHYLPEPTSVDWSAGVEGNTGDAIREGMRLGAATRLMDGAWWCTTISVPGEPAPRLSIMEKSFPGSCVVNMQGERFANESQNYMAFQKDLYKAHTSEVPCSPMYQIFDARFRRDYIVGPLMTAKLKPDNRIPKEWFDTRLVGKANTVKELAEQLGINAENLEATVAKMNSYAKTGSDPDFQRGDSAYDRYYGDPRFEPNPCLGAIDEAPFYAIRVDAGDFGTQGGLVTNPDAQVLKENGEAIAGLYATGNCSAAVLPTYPGPGSTLGPAMTFAYQAAKHISGFKD
ncbi:FAD-dependent oxidoreductase [Spongiibacter sp. KMU-158]|uniref:3-oxosteroid 1-dehydrogenase n=1 Tax=Spongiibacter pelagi TaxID=2760804 RepID=A0A927C0D4_9GAMM|nr:FAD-binding protein [Spongiibacter pelagi]MBD2858399.1 FAD-dependent oxidoreductase [Spongiibacter pelagi]